MGPIRDIYVDGSFSFQTLKAGAGIWFDWSGFREQCLAFRELKDLSNFMRSAFLAELLAINEGLSYAELGMRRERHAKFRIFSDCKPAIKATVEGDSVVSQFYERLKDRVEILWCPGHAGVYGNVRADRLANRGRWQDGKPC